MQNYDKIIFDLQEEVKKKKKDFGVKPVFRPITNCSLPLDQVRYNIHTLDTNTLMLLIGRLHVIASTQTELFDTIPLIIGGYDVKDWLTDLNAKLSQINYSVKEDELKKIEDKLKDLLSNDAKVNIELENLKKQLQ